MANDFSKNRIVKNTLLLYVRMLFTMWLNLYTTRLVLTNLGVEDMGVYGVVGSITSLFTIFVSGITNSIQRFITFELGRKNGNVNEVFCTSLNLLFIISFILIILLEVGGVWILYNKINIPATSQDAAFWVFQLSVLTCVVGVISIPYNALVIAHEKMNTFAYISILQVILTCGTAYSLSLFQQNNRLLIYALFMAIIGILIRAVYQIYCHIKFKESQYHWSINKNLLKEIGKYAGISTTSSILYIISNQGITFVINWTFGVTINAVYNIAVQLKNMILSFTFNMTRAVSPQITKTYAAGETELHKKIVYSSSKIGVFLILFIMLPFLFRTQYIMELWLKEVPDYTVFFVQSIVFVSLIVSAMEPVKVAVLATNRIFQYMIIPDSFFILALPLSYWIGNLTSSPNMMMLTIAILDCIGCLMRIYIGIKETSLNIFEYIKIVIIPCFKVGSISCVCCYGFSILFKNNFWGLIVLLICNSFSLITIIFLIGLNKSEKLLVKQIANKLFIQSFKKQTSL